MTHLLTQKNISGVVDHEENDHVKKEVKMIGNGN
jgi:hypothetical protein